MSKFFDISKLNLDEIVTVKIQPRDVGKINMMNIHLARLLGYMAGFNKEYSKEYSPAHLTKSAKAAFKEAHRHAIELIESGDIVGLDLLEMKEKRAIEYLEEFGAYGLICKNRGDSSIHGL